ncbi:hypothetical protein [Paenibacillus alba]|uniref:Transposase n=1 Tax=Paenibacillus alba TaxID=1197127 RepID=A0ABU6G812_9BACL|nr:hypothetical protein [Paenibacillus alba]MEC0229765.1 hypothetical protein [Paenibacillus alba]
MVKHQQVALEVQTHILKQQDDGISLADLCADEQLPGGPYTEKTLWRWTKRWREIVEKHSRDFVAWTLKLVPQAPFPLGSLQPSLWKWLSRWWVETREQILSWKELSAIQSLRRYVRVIGGVATSVNPTKCVHR